MGHLLCSGIIDCLVLEYVFDFGSSILIFIRDLVFEGLVGSQVDENLMHVSTFGEPLDPGLQTHSRHSW